MFLAMSSLTKVFPVPVGPCRESTRGFSELPLFMNPFIAFRMMGDAMCCPNRLLSRSAWRPGECKAESKQDNLNFIEQAMTRNEQYTARYSETEILNKRI